MYRHSDSPPAATGDYQRESGLRILKNGNKKCVLLPINDRVTHILTASFANRLSQSSQLKPMWQKHALRWICAYVSRHQAFVEILSGYPYDLLSGGQSFPTYQYKPSGHEEV